MKRKIKIGIASTMLLVMTIVSTISSATINNLENYTENITQEDLPINIDDWLTYYEDLPNIADEEIICMGGGEEPPMVEQSGTIDFFNLSWLPIGIGHFTWISPRPLYAVNSEQPFEPFLIGFKFRMLFRYGLLTDHYVDLVGSVNVHYEGGEVVCYPIEWYARIPKYNNESWGLMGKMDSVIFQDSYPGGPNPEIEKIELNVRWREDFVLRRWFNRNYYSDHSLPIWLEWLLDQMCFTEGTKIKMFDNTTKNIEDVQVGDLVISYNIETNQSIPGIVTKTIRHEAEEMDPYYLIINDELGVTPNHFFASNGHFLMAEQLCNGVVIDSDVEIYSIEEIFEKVDTYDLWVEPYVEGGYGMMFGGDGGNGAGGSHELGGIPSTPLNRILLPYGVEINESVVYPTKTPLSISDQIQIGQEIYLKFLQIKQMINNG